MNNATQAPSLHESQSSDSRDRLIEVSTAATAVVGFTVGILSPVLELLDRASGAEVIPDKLAGLGLIGGIAVGSTAWSALSTRMKRN